MHDKDDEFEKQVQETLQDLRFAPSPPVWDRIESQLPIREGRRGSGTWLLWTSLLGAAMIGGYFFFYPVTNADEINSTLLVSTPREKSPASLSENLAAVAPAEKGTDKHSEKEGTKQPGKKDSAAPNKANDGKKDSQLAEANKANAGEGNSLLAATNKANAGGNVNAGERNLQLTEAFRAELRALRQTDVKAAPFLNNTYPISVKPVQKSAGMDVPAVPEAVVAKRKRWSFEISANTGQSIFNSGEVNKLFTAAQLSVLNNRLPPPGMSLTAAIVRPAEVNPGWSVALGGDARYYLSRRVSITGGLYYNLLTTEMEIGDKVSRSVRVQQNNEVKELDTYYSNGYGNNYTNNYHFVEIPVLVYAQLNRGRKLPLYMNGGLSYARLVSTDALHYDGSLNIYYNDPALVKKDFVNVEGGFSARFFANKAINLLAGPEIQYGLTNLLKGGHDNGDKHSLFVGLKVGVAFR